MNKKTFIRMSLEEMGISTYDDYVKKMEIWESSDERVWHGGQEKINAIRNLVVNYYDIYKYEQLEGQYISIDPNECHSDLISNYMCLFPKRSFIETSALLTYIDMTPYNGEEYDLPPNDFMKQYFRFEKLLQNNMAHLYPIKRDEERNNIDGTIFGSTSIIPLKNVASVSQNGSLKRVVQRSDMFYMAFPWLYNANTDDFIEICDKYPAEFECMANAIEKLAKAGNGQTNLQNGVMSELKDALCNIQISYDKKRFELKRKGINAVLGVALTCIPFAVTHFFENFDASILQGILGSASLLESKGILNEFWDLKTHENMNPYWVVWKWKQSTNRNNNQ